MKNHFIIWSTLLLIAILASACKVGKDYERPEVSLPDNFRNVSFADTSSIASLPWKTFLTDTALQNLVNKGIQYNYNLQMAVNRIGIAEAALKQAKAAGLPQVNLLVSGQYNRPSNNSLSGLSTSSFLGSSHIENYNAGLSVAWEADTWGKIRRGKEAALATYLQTYEATRAVQTQLVADIARGYFNTLLLAGQLGIARQALRLSDSVLQMTTLLKEAGETNSLAVQQADVQKQTTALLIPQLEESLALQENALQVLTGQLPAPLKLSATLGDVTVPVSLPPGVPSALLSRRPDIRAAELALTAANARAGVAQGNLYPVLNITAAGGIESFKASNWFNIPGSLFGIAGGTLLTPVFNRRELKTRYEIAKKEREQAVLQFRETVLNAVGEVSDALVRHEKLAQQQEIAVKRAALLKTAVANAKLLYQSDMANYLEVISAQTNALQAELSLADICRAQRDNMVELYRSLGGGWK
ncbi:efflux transporter outer membrane subunit [Hufsiella ginkgonis]|uniref:Efflux transporter outer membrane subunit n=1 Tax=Hufsiella ginkgonis TaxID=2695274 RepID=A0A7K1Y337_9SPHI|nr:efflux transporter outer membrane subunit [Hufsiella ginkgonis]MXV17695.1 efflux transporter outer membrane subunit [Hufsiella ginkgonis]